ncbi:histidine-type phosphatase [Azospirillum palustre]
MKRARVRASALLGAAFVVGGLLSAPAPARAAETRESVEKAVIFSRHGVRPPTETHKIVPLSTRDWPSWPVPDGHLTPHGRDGAVLMGQFYRSRFVGNGLLPGSGCPAAGDVFAWANTDQRTRETGNGILEGLFPGCGLKAASKPPQGGRDVLFAPIAQGLSPLDPASARAGVLEAMGGSIDAYKAKLAPLFARLDAVLPGPRPETCRKAGLAEGCHLIDLPWAIDQGKDKGRNIGLDGPLDLASTIAETFRLEYMEGMAADRVGWGRVGADEVRDLMALRMAKYDVIEHVPYIARRGVSFLLQQIVAAMNDGAGPQSPAAGSGGPPPAKLTLLVGHDTNIGHMRAVMQVGWALEGSQPNDSSPTGAMLFERLKDGASGKRYVRLSFAAPTADQVRGLTPLTGDAGPRVAALELPGCTDRLGPGTCELSQFTALVSQRLDPTAVGKPDYSQ